MSFSTINMTTWVAVWLYYVVFMNIPATLKLIHCLHIHAYLWYMHKQAAQSSLAIKKSHKHYSQGEFLNLSFSLQSITYRSVSETKKLKFKGRSSQQAVIRPTSWSFNSFSSSCGSQTSIYLVEISKRCSFEVHWSFFINVHWPYLVLCACLIICFRQNAPIFKMISLNKFLQVMLFWKWKRLTATALVKLPGLILHR